MSRAVKGSTDAHALRLIAERRILCDPATGVILVDGIPRGISHGSGYQRIYAAGVYMQSHRVIWLSVHGPIRDGYVINHIDGNRRNNRLENLEAVTQRQNVQHAHDTPNYHRNVPERMIAEPVDEDAIEHLMETPNGIRHANRRIA